MALAHQIQPYNNTKTELEIVPAAKHHMPTIMNFVRSTAAWYETFLSPADMAEHYVDHNWAEKNFKLRDFYIGFLNDSPVGTISLQYFEEYAYLGYIYLDKQFVGQGFGHQLMEHARTVAKRRQGIRGLALIAHPQATWAINAYLKFGFICAETDKQKILAWQNGALEPHYEQGFDLYTYSL